MGKAQAKDLHADVEVTIKNWPSKSIRLGPFHHVVDSQRVGNPDIGDLGGPIRDQYKIPQITPQIAHDLDSGQAYIAVQWQASYGDGFGKRVNWPSKRTCEVWIRVGYLKCQVAERSFIDGWYGGRTNCADVDSLRDSRAKDLSRDQSHCQKPQ